MKEYPSIPRCPRGHAPNVQAHVFLKHDGSNLRFEFSAKHGWYKFGTRHRLFDKTDATFGHAIPLFKRTLADPILETIRSKYPKASNFTVFTEYFGPSSFAGHHLAGESACMTLKLFDVCTHKRGFLSPAEFVELFGAAPYAATYFGEYLIDERFVQSVRAGDFNSNEHPEGVVCKWGEGHSIERMKIKTNQYIEMLKQRFKEDWDSYE